MFLNYKSKTYTIELASKPSGVNFVETFKHNVFHEINDGYDMCFDITYIRKFYKYLHLNHNFIDNTYSAYFSNTDGYSSHKKFKEVSFKDARIKRFDLIKIDIFGRIQCL